jgi:polar amino acid transport system substrate-binding protein
VESLKGRRVGIEADVYYKQYLQEYPDIQLVEIEDTHQLMRRLSFGEVEAVVTNINIGNYMIKQHMLENVELAGKIDISAIENEDLRIGVSREKKQLQAILQDGINSVSINEYKELQDRWVGFTPDKMQNMLMPEDRAIIERYIDEKGGFRLSFNDKWYPVDFLNDKKGHSGISAQMFREVSEEYNVPMLEQPASAVQGPVKSVLKGNADILPAIVPTSALRDKLTFTKPYLSLPLVIATRREEFFVGDLDKFADKQIGIVNRGNILRRFENNYPSLSFQTVDSVHEGLQRVEKEQDFAFVGTIPSIAYAVQKHNLFNIKISGKLEETLPVSAAVRSGQEDLAGVLDKMLQSIPVQRREEMIDRWISISLEEKVDYSIIWQISGISVFIIAVAIIWLRKVHAYNREIAHAYALLEDKNRELEQMSVTSQLTGLYNRNKLDPELEQEKERALRYKSIFSVIMLDIDEFKSINDNFGHQTGDRVLKNLGELIQNRVRASDTAGRWGGEEFLIICPATDLSGAYQLAERIRQDMQLQTTPEGMSVTISAGVAEYKSGEDTETLVKRVDGKLYEAKRSGRNRVKS